MFWGFVGSPRVFWGFAPFDHPRHLKYAVPTLGFKPNLTSLVPVRHSYFYLDYLKTPDIKLNRFSFATVVAQIKIPLNSNKKKCTQQTEVRFLKSWLTWKDACENSPTLDMVTWVVSTVADSIRLVINAPRTWTKQHDESTSLKFTCMHFTAKRITYFLQKVKKVWDREGILGLLFQ